MVLIWDAEHCTINGVTSCCDLFDPSSKRHVFTLAGVGLVFGVWCFRAPDRMLAGSTSPKTPPFYSCDRFQIKLKISNVRELLAFFHEVKTGFETLRPLRH